MEENKKALFREIFAREPLSPRVLMAVLAVLVLLGFAGIDAYFDWIEVVIWLLAFALLATSLVYVRRFYRLIACHEAFRKPFFLLTAGTVLLMAGAFLTFACVRWGWSPELIYIFIPAVVLDIAAAREYEKGLEAFGRDISEKLGEAWTEHRRKIRNYILRWVIVGVIIGILGALFLRFYSPELSEARNGWAGLLMLLFFVVRFSIIVGSLLSLATIVLFIKINRADKDMIDRTIAEMNRAEVETWKLLNP